MYNNIKKVELKLRMKRIVKILVILFLLLGIIFFCKRFIDSDYFKVQEVLGLRLTSYHNLHFLIKLMKDAREAIKEKRFKEFKENFIKKYEGK